MSNHQFKHLSIRAPKDNAPRRKWLISAAAVVGATALTFGGAVVPAGAEETPAPAPLNGEASKYELAAEYTGSSVTDIQQLEKTDAAEVTADGYVRQIDPSQSAEGVDSDLGDEPAGAAIPGDATTGSRPGAPVTVYLDFDGERLEDTRWNSQYGSKAIDLIPARSADPAFQAGVWAAVAEDFAPFDINVTTTRPSDDALYKTSEGDDEYGAHVIITDSFDETLPDVGDTGGQAWLSAVGSQYLTGALVFTTGVSANRDPSQATVKSIADTASHEAGHNFGLAHDGLTGAAKTEYYVPNAGAWGPIMGATFRVPMSQWSKGDYAGASNAEDDLAVITDRSVASRAARTTTASGEAYAGSVCAVAPAVVGDPQPGDRLYAPVNGACEGTGEPLTLQWGYQDRADMAPDTVGDTAADATALELVDGAFSAGEVIQTAGDVDVYRVTTEGGAFTATVSVANVGPNLDAKLTLTDGSGVVLAEDDPKVTRDTVHVAGGLNASISTDLDAGEYFLTVDGVGAGDPETATPVDSHGYTDYGSLGNYALSGTVSAPSTP